jgi:hypothetical protein
MAKKPSNNPNGRPKGSPNKRTEQAIAIFGEFDFCPLEEILEKLKELDKLSKKNPLFLELYLNTCLKLMKFKFPERKAVEHTFDPRSAANDELLETTKMLLAEFEGRAA